VCDAYFAFYSPLTHADGLVIGCLLGQLYALDLLPSAARPLRALRVASVSALGVVLAVLFTVSSDSRLLYEDGFTIAVVASALVVLAALDEAPTLPFRILGWRPLRYMRKISYALYLWNTVFLFN
jgi:peptidoglycan/LPS O-acetylase OafA/YrhL